MIRDYPDKASSHFLSVNQSCTWVNLFCIRMFYSVECIFHVDLNCFSASLYVNRVCLLWLLWSMMSHSWKLRKTPNTKNHLVLIMLKKTITTTNTRFYVFYVFTASKSQEHVVQYRKHLKNLCLSSCTCASTLHIYILYIYDLNIQYIVQRNRKHITLCYDQFWWFL